MPANPSFNPEFDSDSPSRGTGDLIYTFRDLIFSPPILPVPPDEASRLDEFIAEGFASYVMVELTGDLFVRNVSKVRINGSRPVHIDRREFVVLLVLAWYARFWATLPTAARAGRSPYLSASDILDYIDELKVLLAPNLPVFCSGDPLDVTKVISQFRDHLRASGEDDNILQTGPSHFGYRWSIPPRNLIVRFAPPARPR